MSSVYIRYSKTLDIHQNIKRYMMTDRRRERIATSERQQPFVVKYQNLNQESLFVVKS